MNRYRFLIAAAACIVPAALLAATIQIAAVSYVWPASQGAAGTSLVNNGSGTLAWSSNLLSNQVAAGEITGTAADATIFTYSMPGNTLPATGCLRVTVMSQHTTGVLGVPYKLAFGATSITDTGAALAATGPLIWVVRVCNSATNAQQIWSDELVEPAATNMIASPQFATAAVDTTATVIIKFTFNAANTQGVTPKAFMVELIQ